MACSLLFSSFSSEKVTEEMPIRRYYQMTDSLRRGWHSWDTRSMFTQLYLPEAFSVKVSLEDEEGREAADLRPGNLRRDAAEVHPGDHTHDNAYSEVDARWHGISVKLRSTATDDRLIMLLTPQPGNGDTGRIRIRPEYCWPYANTITERDRLAIDGVSHFMFSRCDNHARMEGGIVATGLQFHDGYYSCKASQPILVFTGDSLGMDEAERILNDRKQQFDEECARYGKNKELYRAIQSVLGWDTVYDPGEDIVVSPVNRNWNVRWAMVPNFGGFVLFDWDTYFASLMCSCFSRELAYSNAVEVTLSVDKCGFVPKSRSDHSNLTKDCSQPPVGSMAVWNIYRRFGEKWFLELLYPRLLTWNRWWPQARQTDGLLCWGSNPVRQRLGERRTGSTNHAVLESGLDNSTMYDEVKINKETWQLDYQDVGLTSLYVMDCDYLAMIARELGLKKDARELERRADFFRQNIQRFWCEEDGMFYNRNVETGEFSRHTSATNFYVLQAKAAKPEQARRIVEEHLRNEKEFWGEWVIPMTPKTEPGYKDQSYWRGRIWGPTNFLVYLGLRNYPDASVRKELVEKSARLLLKGWQENGYIFENWNAITGEGFAPSNSDCFYHWGALLGYMSLMEEE